MSTWARLQGRMVDYADATYRSIKDAASRWSAAMRREPESASREYGFEDFLAMTSQRDPFYVGQPSSVAMAEWFMECWRLQGMDRRYADGRPVYVRSMHYIATAEDRRVEMPPPPWGGGAPTRTRRMTIR